MADYATLVSARGYVKSSITRLYNFVKSDAFDKATKSILLAKRERLISAFKDYEGYNMKILTTKPQGPESAEDVGEQEDKYVEILARLNDAIAAFDKEDDQLKTNKEATLPLAQIKLPNVQICTFTGKYYGEGREKTAYVDRIPRIHGKESHGTGNCRRSSTTVAVAGLLCKGTRSKAAECLTMCCATSSMPILSSCLIKSCRMWTAAPLLPQLRASSARNLAIY
ncbi:uncharacterized protein LOC126371630 [Pectinophora gossypiella]|uniref:uncharacterized protein LOC126371630 n=2 Tax=Pectinophora gossypiella TaxID=13191 RepID=UPI00214E1FB8|nr:uncharacterized protein LOC126371630 [Pectinophora gossypiella]